MKSSLYAAIAVIVIIVLAGGYYLTTRSSSPTTSKSTNTQASVTPTATPTQTTTSLTPLATQTLNAPTTSSTTSITISGKEYSFSPNKIQVSKGTTVKLTFTNNGTMEHNLVIPSLNLSTKTISPGQSDTIQFTANQTGTFDYYCSISNHKTLGMTGTLTVK